MINYLIIVSILFISVLFIKRQVQKQQLKDKQQQINDFQSSNDRTDIYLKERESEFLELYEQEYGYNGEIDKVRQQFPKLSDIIYLDHTASTLCSEAQIEQVYKDIKENIYCNPHSMNPLGLSTKDKIDTMREEILDLFNAPYREYSVIFTSGCTDALKKVGEYFPWEPGFSKFYYSMESHNSVLGIREYAAEYNCSFKAIPKIYFKSSDSRFTEILDIIEHGNHQNGKDSTIPNINNGFHLFSYPAQCNYSGSKYPLELINVLQKKSNGRVKVLLDVASFVPTSKLDLTRFKPDFLTLSFYKMFGYPTGLGALIVRNDSIGLLKKKYFGGGSVNASLAQERFHLPRDSPIMNLEDGTVSYLSICSLKYGLKILKDLQMERIQSHTFSLAQYLFEELQGLQHSNGRPLAVIYSDNHYTNTSKQGGIVNLNLLRANGLPIGYNEVEKIASLNNIYFRTGCFCNPGACHTYLELTLEDIKKQIADGHVCWDDKDLVDGKLTGSIRISFGYMSNFRDCYKFLEFLKLNFLDDFKNQLSTTITTPKQQQLQLQQQDLIDDSGVSDNSTNNIDYSLKLDELYVYPVKSCGGYKVLSRWEIVDSGLKYDREWTIIDKTGNYLNQKRLPILAQIYTEIDLEKSQLILTVPEMKPLILPLDYYPVSAFDKIQVCGDKVDGLLYGPSDIPIIGCDCSDWLYQFTGKHCYLVRKSPVFQRISKLTQKNTDVSGDGSQHENISFANESPFLLINQDSVLDLKRKIKAQNPNSKEKWNWISKHSFRANLIVSSLSKDKSYQEDNWDEFIIDDLLFKSIGDCNRCKMICINQKMGIEEKEPLATLSTYRRNKGKIIFGQHLQLIKSLKKHPNQNNNMDNENLNEENDNDQRIFINIPSKIHVLSLNSRNKD